MFLHQRFVPGLSILSYIVGDEKTGKAVVIDPMRDVDPYLQVAEANNLTITDIVETHVHADFVSGAHQLKQRLDGKPTIHCSGLGGEAWIPPYADEIVGNGDSFHLGQLRIEAIHTPGHTPEHVSWALYDEQRSSEDPWMLFTGDFLFVGDVGRPDLLGEQARRELAHQLYNSVFERIADLPDHVEIYPAHGPGSLCGKAIGSRLSSTLGYERRHSAAFVKQPEKQWTETLLHEMPPAPAYFKRMKQVNVTEPVLLGDTLPGEQALTPAQVHQVLADGHRVLDIRSPEAFASAHIPGALNIHLEEGFATWAGFVLPADRPVVLVAPSREEAARASRELVRIGLDGIDGYLAGGISAWEAGGYEVAQLQVISAHTLHEQLNSPQPPVVLDVRTDAEWHRGHIHDAVHIHGGLLAGQHSQLPDDRPIAVVCGAGFRASVASSLLKGLGYSQVMTVLGGMAAWKAASLPTAPTQAQAA